MTERDSIIHLIAGGVAGTAGAVVTCPLEVVKTRLQSSNAFLPHPTNRTSRSKELSGIQSSSSQNNDALSRPEQRRKFSSTILRRIRPQRSAEKMFRKNLAEKIRHNVIDVYAISHCGISSAPKSMSILQCLRHIVQTEGTGALFKGLGPNLVGVAPSRAIYFCTYSQTKEALSSMGLSTDSPYSHILSAMCAGFVSSTSTNPIWFVKTRLQLDFNSERKMTVKDCIRNIYQESGLRGFYKGITASYFGISETVVHFVIYETLKRKLVEYREKRPDEGKSTRDFLEFMACGAFSKTIASCIAYPHEVARTRLREAGNKYHSFWQTLFLVWKEEGKAGLYRGLATQLVRQIPNTAIMMATYEAVVYVLSMKFNATFYLDSHHRNGNGKN